MSRSLLPPPTKQKTRPFSGGIVGDDWSTLQAHKLKNIELAHPQPTQFSRQDVAATDASATPESCKVEGLDLAALAAATSPAAAAPAQQQQQQQAPAGEIVFSEPGKLTVRRATSWMDGGAECVQFDCAVEQGGAGRSVALVLPAGCSVNKSWNCVQQAGGAPVFGPPEWAANGAGSPYVAGIVVTGGMPTGFSLV